MDNLKTIFQHIPTPQPNAQEFAHILAAITRRKVSPTDWLFFGLSVASLVICLTMIHPSQEKQSSTSSSQKLYMYDYQDSYELNLYSR
ncbi:MAG: hypothetical protein R3A11_00580 [Bdellovibrionota bacterium]